MTVACLRAGSKLAHDGSVWSVVALSGDGATIEDRASGSTRSVAITLLAGHAGADGADGGRGTAQRRDR